ncbi:MAG: bifunctional phosphopantothenoylcysteine decarboxylase/phosphopantothenate--cysteine ligase CoaBC [Gemmatimonadota bacterium]|nr:MAG: bifunctional phosphopantothenoylcysteine decarboxylase/phosphopantothenate--cysteine ligase CoaBC [Gemmatimonadota bacterium]
MCTGKNILLGVTGSIAAYKSAELVRGLKVRGADVHVIMTRSAQKFISALTFQTLSGHRVVTEMFPQEEISVPHIKLAEWADVILVAPATANILGKVASGLADDMLSTVVLASKAPLCFAPAMNARMLSHPVVVDNIRKLKDRGCTFIEPERGELACGTIGEGRLADLEAIIDGVMTLCDRSGQLSGKHVLVTAGRTEEPLDPVRFLTNPATGKMGYALAEAAHLRGARVSLISGPTHISPPPGIDLFNVRTAEEMARKAFELYEECDIVLMAAAVADFRPKNFSTEKIKKNGAGLTVALERTEDILADFGRRKSGKILIGFALETDDGVENATEKLNSKNLDLIVLNCLGEEGAGFGGDTNIVTLIDRFRRIEKLPKLTKRDLANRILDRVVDLVNE